MTALVIGASGQVGTQLMRLLVARGQRAIGTYSGHPAPGLVHLDLRSNAECAQRINETRPHVVLCVGAMTHVDLCETEPDLARQINVTGPLACAQAARAIGARFVYFSTDYVFDGRSGPYREDDPPNPINVYGRTKVEAEKALLDADPSNLIVRTMVVYGVDPQQKNFVYQLLARGRKGEQMRAPDDQFACPTYNEDLAEATLRLVELGASGVFHVSGPEMIDRYSFARVVCEVFGLDASLLFRVKTSDLKQKAPRPLKTGFHIEKMVRLTGFRPRAVRGGLEVMKQRLAEASLSA